MLAYLSGALNGLCRPCLGHFLMLSKNGCTLENQDKETITMLKVWHLNCKRSGAVNSFKPDQQQSKCQNFIQPLRKLKNAGRTISD